MNPILAFMLIWLLLCAALVGYWCFLNSWKSETWHYIEIARDILGMERLRRE